MVLKKAPLILTAPLTLMLFAGMGGALFSDTPFHHWDFSSASSQEVRDRGRGASQAKVVGNPTVSKEGLALGGGMEDYLEVANDGFDALENAFTFALWMRPQTVTKMRAFGKIYRTNPTWATPNPGLMTSATGLPLFASWGGDGSKEKMAVEGKSPLVPGAWVHVVATFDGEALTLYIDGVEVNRKAVSFKHRASPGPFFIGRIKDSERSFQGTLGELIIDDRTWSSREVAEAHQKGLTRFSQSVAVETAKSFPSEPMASKRAPNDPWAINPTTPFHLLTNYPRQGQTVKMDRFGGSLERTEKATGYFYTQKHKGRWWLITPEGHPFIHMALVAVGPNGTKTAKNLFKETFGTTEIWAEKTTGLLKQYGFNGTGAWSDVKALELSSNRVVTTLIKNYMADFARSKKLNAAAVGHSGYVNEAIPIFDPDFETFAATYAQEELASYRGNPWLLGIFSDNEIQRPKLVNYLELDPGIPAQDLNRRGALAFLAEATGKKDPGKADVTPVIQAKFHAFVLAKYYRVVSQAIHKALPNHLYLGSRLHDVADKENPHLWKAIGPYIDLISLNYYGDWTPDLAMVSGWSALSEKPVIITEWYVKGDDVGFANTTGAGWTVKTQRDRGLWYQHFALGLLACKNVVGWHWFKYMDNDPTDTSADPSNRDSNKGLIKNDWSIYTEPAELMRAFNGEVYPLIQWLDAR